MTRNVPKPGSHPGTPLTPEKTKTCRGPCGERKYLRQFYREPGAKDGHRGVCKTCRCDQRAAGSQRRSRPCIDCGRKVRHARRCNACRLIQVADIQAALAPSPPNPNVCGLPMQGGHCHEAIIWGVNQFGYLTIYCAAHGERLMPRTLPKAGVLHTQREDLEREMTSSVKRARLPADPERSARARGRGGITIQKAGNFSVVGSALAWKLAG